MGIVAKDSGDSFERELAPSGLQDAVCSKIFDLGKQLTDYNGQQKIQHKVLFVWELAEVMQSGDYAGKRFVVHREYTLSLHEKAALRNDLQSWMDKTIDDETARQGVELEKFIGRQCTLSIFHQTSKSGNEYAKVTGVNPVAKSAPMLHPELEEGWCPAWIQSKMDEAVADEGKQAGEVGVQEEDVPVF